MNDPAQDSIDPVKVCCGKQTSEHNGPVCPDGLVQCCICFKRFEPTPATEWDLCPDCEISEASDAQLDRIERGDEWRASDGS